MTQTAPTERPSCMGAVWKVLKTARSALCCSAKRIASTSWGVQCERLASVRFLTLPPSRYEWRRRTQRYTVPLGPGRVVSVRYIVTTIVSHLFLLYKRDTQKVVTTCLCR